MIEVGSFIGMAAMVGGGLTIRDVGYDQLGIIPESFRRIGVRIERRGDDLFIPEQRHYCIESFIDGSFMTLADAPWPGLTTRPAQRTHRRRHAGTRLGAFPSENVRKPPFLRR